jgi:hypothetical protein
VTYAPAGHPGARASIAASESRVSRVAEAAGVARVEPGRCVGHYGGLCDGAHVTAMALWSRIHVLIYNFQKEHEEVNSWERERVIVPSAGLSALASPKGGPPHGDRMTYFFLSYARTPKADHGGRDDPDRWVYKLYRDLSSAILQMTSARPEEAGFMDRENRLGVAWSPELSHALATCRVFVPLYSQRYFESENCGKEWSAFSGREVTMRTSSRGRVP